MFDLDYPAMLGVVQNQDSYAQGVAAQRPFYFDHIARAGRPGVRGVRRTHRSPVCPRAAGYRLDDAEWVIVGQGSVVSNAEAVADYLRERAGPRGRRAQPDDVPAVPGRPRQPRAGGQEGRRGAGAHRPATGRRCRRCCARSARRCRRAVENGRAPAGGAAAAAGLPALRAEQVPDFYSGVLRPRQPRPAAGGHRRRGREHAARRRAAAPVLSRHRLHSPRHPHARSCRSGRSGCSTSYPGLGESVAARGGASVNLLPDGLDGGPDPFGRRLGRDHHGQEPRDDGVRALRHAHQGEPEIRLGEEGAADDVLCRAVARAGAAQLRAEARRRGAVAGPERLPAQRSAGRPGRRRACS